MDGGGSLQFSDWFQEECCDFNGENSSMREEFGSHATEAGDGLEVENLVDRRREQNRRGFFVYYTAIKPVRSLPLLKANKLAMQLVQARSVMLWSLTVFMFSIILLQHYHYSLRSHYQLLSEKETTLHFFLHDTPGGPNPSAVRIIQSNAGLAANSTALTPFGTMWVVDDPLTVGPEPSSTVIGNCRGVYVSAGQSELMLVAYLDFGFTAGEFSGSSISMLSRNPVREVEREFAVVGGQGKLRMARGYAKLKCIFYNESNGDSIVEYTVIMRHFITS
ncbi:hypothetical protein Dsin_026288 [Dipteronia sinensis]|uniref:Dirigent protein n=1 Tax=Dipteronia sinensis TaxID=43782 RepID=A0AAD9ZYW1_9ROSI|nr:hypothetical protein Dsin_026288 [Dipteronia sinensis]